MKRMLIFAAGLGILLVQLARADDANASTRIQWWRDAKFGIFIHWGLYSIPGRGEWVQWNEQIPVKEYAKLADQFDPTNFSPVSWAQLAKVAGRDGNLLMNIGPDRNGRVDTWQADRLREIGKWLGKYGASIYDTRGGPFLPGDWGASTHRGNTIYLHVLKWPGDQLVLPAVPAKIVSAITLTGGKASFSQTDKSVELSVSPAPHDEMDTIVAL